MPSSQSLVVTNRAEVSLEEVAAGEGDGPEEDGMKGARLEMAYGCTCLIKHLLGLASPGCQAGHLTLGSEGQAEHFFGGSSSPLPHPARSLELAGSKNLSQERAATPQAVASAVGASVSQVLLQA